MMIVLVVIRRFRTMKEKREIRGMRRGEERKDENKGPSTLALWLCTQRLGTER